MNGDNVGAIFYTVDADTEKVITGLDALEKSVGSVNKTLGTTDAAAGKVNTRLTATAAASKQLASEAGSANSQLAAMTKLLGGIVTLQGAGNLVRMAEAYGEMAERVQMATSSAAEYENVQMRLLTTANNTYRALSEAQELYILTSDSLRSMGYSTDQALDITDSLSYSFVKNATSVQRAQSAISAFTGAIMTGKVEADAWKTIIGAVPSVIADIATASGKTTSEIRKLGAEGKLTADMLNEGLRKSLDANKTAAEGMATTVKDAYTQLLNNVSAYVGEVNAATGATSVMAKAIMLVGTNVDTLAKLMLAVGAGALAKITAQMALKTIASLKDVAATRAAALAEINLAKAQVASAQAALASTQAHSSDAAAKSVATARTNALAAATTRLALASKATGTGAAVIASALGGPVGIIGLAATAAAGFALMTSSTNTAADSLVALDGPLSEVADKYAALGAAQQKLATTAATDALTKSTEDLGSALEAVAQGSMIAGGQTKWTWIKYAGTEMQTLNKQLQNGELSASEYDTAVTKLVEDFAAANRTSKGWVAAMLELVASARQTADTHALASEKVNLLAGAAGRLEAAAKGAAAGLREMGADAGIAGEPGKYMQGLLDSVGKLQDGGSKVKEATRQLEAYAAAGVVVGESVAAGIMSAAAAADNLSAATKRGTAATSEASKAEEKRKTSLAENVKAIEKLAEELERAALSGEALAAAQAGDKLNKFATPEQVARARELAAAIYKIGEQSKAATGLQTLGTQLGLAALKGRELAETQAALSLGQYATPEQIESARVMAGLMYEINAQKQLADKIGDGDISKYIRGDVEPMTGGAFDSQSARYDQEGEKQQQRYESQLVRLREAMEAEKLTLDGYYAQFEKLSEGHNARMAQIAEAKYSTQLSTASDAFGSIAEATKAFSGEQSGIYKAMFAASKAFAIADAIVKIQQGIASAAATPFPQNIPAMASVAAATAGIVSTISGTSMGGGRLYGGAVSPDKMHRINENGRPEVLQTANGNEYLLGAKGKVISNRDAFGGNGGVEVTTSSPISITTYVQIDSSGNTNSSTSASGGGNQNAAGEQMGELIGSMFTEFLERQKRPGGQLWKMLNNR